MAGTFLAICLVDDVGNIIDEIQPDVCTSRTPTYTAQVTKFPVESGGSITDNRRKEPDGYEIEGTISATSMTSTPSSAGQLGGDVSMNAPPAAPAATKSAHDKLLDLHTNDRLVTIIDQYREYENMALTKLSFPRDRETGDAIKFQATFEKVIVVSTSMAALPASVVKRLKTKKRPKETADEKATRLKVKANHKLIAGKAPVQDAKPSLSAKSTAAAAKTPRS